jgi:hypothetical protein
MCSARSYLLAVVCVVISIARGEAQVLPLPASRPRPLTEAYRLLFDSVMTPEGLMVVSIQPQSPALDMLPAGAGGEHGMLQLGDIIAEVDGLPIKSNDDYFHAMDASSAHNGRVALKVLDRNNRVPHQWIAQARKLNVPVPGNPGSGLRKVHFLLIGLTKDNTPDNKVGIAMKKTLPLWQTAIDSISSERHGNIRTLQEDDCQAAKIVTAVSAMQVASRDTLLCVYCGHGAFDPTRVTPDDPSRGHHFQIQPSGDLMRKYLMHALLAKSARLTVLISDTCNKAAVAQPAFNVNDECRTAIAMGLSPFGQLLLNYRGVVDISGTNFDEEGFCDTQIGAWFSVSAIPILQLNSDWRSCFEQIKRAADHDFQINRRGSSITQMHVTPTAFRLDVYRDDPSAGLAAEEPPQQKEFSYQVRRALAPAP